METVSAGNLFPHLVSASPPWRGTREEEGVRSDDPMILESGA